MRPNTQSPQTGAKHTAGATGKGFVAVYCILHLVTIFFLLSLHGNQSEKGGAVWWSPLVTQREAAARRSASAPRPTLRALGLSLPRPPVDLVLLLTLQP